MPHGISHETGVDYFGERPTVQEDLAVREVFRHDDHQRWRLHNLIRKRKEVIEAWAFRQTPRHVIASQAFALLPGSVTRPRLDLIRLQVTDDVKKRCATIEDPDAGEVGLAVSRAWHGSHEVGYAVRCPRDSWRGIFEPLRVKRRSHAKQHGDHGGP